MSRRGRVLRVTLLNLESEARLDVDGSVLAQILTKIGDSTSCCSARSYLSGVDDNDDDERTSWEQQQANILKYIKVKDRYLALASILLKSRAFHEAYRQDEAVNEIGPRRIVALPRTSHKKPYIPSCVLPPPCDEENLYPLSISHQYPYAGMVRLEPSNEMRNARRRQLFAGFDIVVFDEINRKMYDTVQAFVEVFRGSFAATELAAMNDRQRCPDDESQLRELYLRWAIKEAYTKALGVGMGFDFACFETILDSLDDCTSLWSWIDSSSKEGAQLRTTGSVLQIPSPRKDCTPARRPQSEQWLFFFQPFFDSLALLDREDSRRIRGCGCVCIGPFTGVNETESFELDIDWTDLKIEIAWHGIS